MKITCNLMHFERQTNMPVIQLLNTPKNVVFPLVQNRELM